MALRVLLADESSTIKKVFQLALQDFAVDVRPVNVGSDVAEVAQSFKPDIVFADVLLQKRNGYDVSSELKRAEQLRSIPVVLMWSSFMELDEDKFQASHADARLEKPFDVTALRKLVTDLVPKTQGQRMSQFLAFPTLPDFEENQPPVPPPLAPVEAAPAATKESDAEDFERVSIPRMKNSPGWNQSSKHRVELSPEEQDPDYVPVDVDAIFGQVESESELADEDDEFTLNERRPTLESAPAPAPVTAGAIPQMDAAALEALVREQSRAAIEALVWKIVPDLATQIIERELNRLLQDRETQPY